MELSPKVQKLLEDIFATSGDPRRAEERRGIARQDPEASLLRLLAEIQDIQKRHPYEFQLGTSPFHIRELRKKLDEEQQAQRRAS
ncbi:hypothetical protein C4552_03190 [Candidatus Parcubacteria bacterium]|nr:MAG: hypothetical protein C4552_03190 [Candidatus Parcubacteria bacterium]